MNVDYVRTRDTNKIKWAVVVDNNRLTISDPSVYSIDLLYIQDPRF